MNAKHLILGGGVTGLCAGLSTHRHIYEAENIPGGICASYYVSKGGVKTFHRDDNETYRFETGGGHWLFGTDGSVLKFINNLTPTKTYTRKSAIYFPDKQHYVPYPLQNHLAYLENDIAEKALHEIIASEHNKQCGTMEEWLDLHFGKTLCELFFFPFHELYTAGLFNRIAPQDQYKTPVDKETIVKGLHEKYEEVGYNTTYIYPNNGLDDLIRKMSTICTIDYNSRIVKINTSSKEVVFDCGKTVKYDTLISTLPLVKVLQMTNLLTDEYECPYTSVLVINIGAKKGKKCPDDHWLYIPKSKAGFHRVGFYSNVSDSFLPLSSRQHNNRVSIYVEKAYFRKKPGDEEISTLYNDIAVELASWGFIEDIEVIDHNWIEVAYTWRYPGNQLIGKSLDLLEQHGIHQLGRYGRWEFQGLAKSIRDGLEVKQQLQPLALWQEA